MYVTAIRKDTVTFSFVQDGAKLSQIISPGHRPTLAIDWTGSGQLASPVIAYSNHALLCCGRPSNLLQGRTSGTARAVVLDSGRAHRHQVNRSDFRMVSAGVINDRQRLRFLGPPHCSTARKATVLGTLKTIVQWCQWAMDGFAAVLPHGARYLAVSAFPQ
jgi:hypothetical protein